MAFSFKDLIFVNKNEKPKTENTVTVSNTKFPKTENTNEPFSIDNGVKTSGVDASPYLAKAIETYQNGFDSLNQTGYDFYEYYQMVSQGGVSIPQSYTMAFSMALVMDKTITKDKLLQQSQFYITEINKVYSDFVAKGSSKKQELLTQKNSENQSLVNQLDLMKQEMDALKTKISNAEYKLGAIEGIYAPKISEIDSKLAANDTAKDAIIKSIEQVKEGINNNLK